MALSSASVQQTVLPANDASPKVNNTAAASMLAALMLGVLAAQGSKRAMRKFKKQAAITLLKYKVNATVAKVRSLFSKNAPAPIDNRTLLYIVLGIAVVVLLIVAPIAALVLVLIAILLYLLLNNK
ncbi:MAG TPA: hypothetical protein VEY06_08430 [Flavisolibacter sp.]|nr:hypothetical protein [Flavisolibacter sp.]